VKDSIVQQDNARFFAPKNGAQNDKMQAEMAEIMHCQGTDLSVP